MESAAPNILVVDDTPANLHLLSEVLLEEGFTVRPALNGPLALTAAQMNPPDVILLDIKMPGMDGFEVCRQLKASPRTCDIPVIFISALHETFDKVKAFEIGGVDYITKPVHPEEVIVRIKTHIRLQHLRQELEQENQERKRAEETLRKSEERLRMLFTTMTEGVILTHPDGRIIQANPAAERILQLTHPTIEMSAYNNPTWEILRSDGTLMPHKEMAGPRAMQEKQAVKNILTGLKHPNGTISWLNVSATPIIDETGHIEGIVCTFADITDRKNAEEASREREERFRSIIENTAAGYFFIDAEGLFQDVNASWLRMYKYASADDVVGKHFTVVQKSDDVEKAKEFVQGIMRDDPRYVTGEFSRRCKDNTVGYHSFSARPVMRAGDVIGIEGFIIDTTERKHMEESLRESEMRFRVLSDATFEAIAFTEQGRVVDANPQFARMLGYTMEEVAGLDVGQLVMPEDREFVRQHILSGSEEPYEHRSIRKDGSMITVEVRPRMMSFQGRPMRVTAVRDITDRKQAQEDLQRYADKLEEANAELSQYAYAVSHDLKAPLRAIRNYADFLREDLQKNLESEQEGYLDNICRAVQESNALIDDLLRFSRLDEHTTDVETIDVGTMLQAVIASQELPDNTEIVMPEAWPTLASVPVLFRQIFQNLLSNAVKFNQKPQKRVELGWQRVGGNGYEFFVRDNGIGIDRSHQENIFRVFQRLHTKEEFEGTGIGLAIVKKAASKLGGTIRVESEPGKGSTFFLTLPGSA